MEQRGSLSPWALVLALVAACTSVATPASAQVVDRDAWANELAWLGTMTARLNRDGRSDEAMELLETMPMAGIVDDPRSMRRLIRIAEALHAPGAEPEWFYAGLPLMIGGAVGAIATGVLHTAATSCESDATAMCPRPDLAPYIAGYVFSAGAFVVGFVLNLVGLVNHTADPERRAFERRRTDVIRAFREARRGIGITW